MHDTRRPTTLAKPAALPARPSVPARDESEKRFAPRRRSAFPAVLQFEDAMDPVQCLIRDMSATGARLELRGRFDENPFAGKWSDVDRIWLIVRADHVMYDCKIVRRSGTAEIGVKFLAAPKPITRVVR